MTKTWLTEVFSRNSLVTRAVERKLYSVLKMLGGDGEFDIYLYIVCYLQLLDLGEKRHHISSLPPFVVPNMINAQGRQMALIKPSI